METTNKHEDPCLENLYIKKFQSYLTYDAMNQQTQHRIISFLYKAKAFDLVKKYISYDTNYNNNYETVLEQFYYEMIQALGHEKAIQLIHKNKKIDYVPPTIPTKTKSYINHMTLEELQREEASILTCMFETLNNSGFFSANIQNFSQLIPRHDYVINRIHEVKRLTAPSWADEMDDVEDVKVTIDEQTEDEDEDDDDIFMDSYEYLDDINDSDSENVTQPEQEEEQEESVEDSEAYKLWYAF
jgi:hypothetical protein